MKENLKQLFADWCFEQGIEPDDNSPITFGDLAMFLDFVELMTDELADDGR